MEHRIRLHTPEGTRVLTARTGDNLYQVLAAARVGMEAPCGGKGTCGKCRVTLVPAGEAGAEEAAFLGEEALARGERLSCRVTVNRDLEVTLKTAASARIMTAGRDAFTARCPYRWEQVTLPLPSLEDPLDDESRLRRACPQLEIPYPLLKELPAVLRQAEGTLSLLRRENRLLELAPGKVSRPLYGVAVDIGTTTLVAYLMDLQTGAACQVASALNPQRPRGDDVITRMDYARQSGEALAEMQALVCGGIGELLERLCAAQGIASREILSMTVAGNTVMSHLFAGIDPQHIATVPFAPAFTRRLTLRGSDLGLAIHPQGEVELLPHVASYVGADIVCSVMASGMDQQDALCLMVDIGTNGEMVLGNRQTLIACSTAAGPALEGAHIRCGLGGVEGAISHVTREGDALRLTTIGDAPPRGLCGSGLVDAIAVLLEAGAVSPAGRMDPDEGPEAWEDRWIFEGRSAALRLTDAEADPPIVLCQRDIREVQLAKGAIAAGIEVMLGQMGRSVEDIAQVYLAGGFGSFMDKRSACAIGLLPPQLQDRITVIGNGAGSGARMALLDSAEKERADALARRISFIELSACPDFQDLFMEKVAFGEEE